MAMPKKVTRGSIVVGCLLLVLTLICVICGSVVISKMPSNATLASLGIWGLYFAVPGVISILAGVKKGSSLLLVALVTHILGTIFAISGVVTGAIFWERLSCNKDTSFRSNSCYYYDIEGSDLETVRDLTGVLALIFSFFAVVTLMGSYCGCAGNCWAPKEPAAMATTARPGTMAMTTQSYPAYNQPPPLHNQGHVVVDTNVQH